MCNVSRVAILVVLTSSLLLPAVSPLARAEEAVSNSAPPPKTTAQTKKIATTSKSKNGEQALRARVKGFWDARVARSEKLSNFYLPPEKGGPPLAKTIDGTNVIWHEYEIDDVKIDGDTATVTIQGRVSLVLAKPVRVPEEMTRPRVSEIWHRTNGVWYREPVESGLRQHPKGPSPEQAQPQVPTQGGSAAKLTEGAKK
jgi:hypothetical protein